MKFINIQIKFGSISLSKAKNIQIEYKGFNVQLEEIAISSNFFNYEISNPIQIFARDIRINKTDEYIEDNVDRNPVKSRDSIKQIPSIIVKLVQVRRKILNCCARSDCFLLVLWLQFLKHFVYLSK
jgi:hypothetical protein